MDDEMASSSSSSKTATVNGQPIKMDQDVDDQSSQDSSLMNNSDSVLHKIANLYAEQLMSDIILVVGNNRYPAHRVILCASSEVFQVMLMNPEWNECRKSVIELKEEPSCSQVFPQFLKYLYVGQIRISLASVMPMLSLADKYNIKDLAQLCVDYMLKHVSRGAMQSYLISWLQYTIALSPYHIEVTETLKRFLKYNIEMVAESRDFIELDQQILILLLQQNDIVVKNEYSLFGILMKWLLCKKDQLDTEENLSDEDKNSTFIHLIESTVIHIRFAMMSPRELAHLLLNPIVAYHKEFLVQRMAIGMSYHSGQNERVAEVFYSDHGILQFTPRLYTNDGCSINMFVTDFEKVEKYMAFVACFFSQRNLAEREDDQNATWEIEFFPRGVKYHKAKMVWGGEELPEVVLRTVRLRVTCKENFFKEERYKIAVLITGVQNKIPHVLTVRESTEYFSESFRVVNIDNLLPYDELALSSPKLSPHLTGPDRNSIHLQVIIIPMCKFTSRDVPPFDFK